MKTMGNKLYKRHGSPLGSAIGGLKVMFWLCFMALQLNAQNEVQVGAEDTAYYFPLIKGKSVAVVVNPTSRVFNQHLLSFLLEKNIQVKKIFGLEHGIYGDADAGAKIKDGVDSKSGLPVVSLYGKSKEPQAKDLEDIDVILFDIQDVGVRFYTYISSLHYIMQAAAKHGKEVIVLDRPNPNGHLVDGPILDNRHKSFVGMHPVPVLHGLSIGEYGLMINGEKWLDNAAICSLTVVPCKNYRRTKEYKLPVKPSPNLPNQQSIYLYPHLCFFEGTHVSVGRGTDFPFQVFGAPFFSDTLFSFTPKSTSGASNPPYLNQTCYGKDLRNFPARELDGLSLEWLIWAYEQRGNKKEFFNSFFRLLAGGTELQEQIEQGLSEEEIKNSWKAGLADFNEKRKKYLLYPN